MSESGEGERKVDVTNIPRGAISLRGVPVNRNARLPSFRSPRDLTLGTPAKRTFRPNIPVRRERKTQDSNENQDASSSKTPQPSTPTFSERNKGRKNDRKMNNIIQTEGSVFGSGIASSPSAGRSKGSGRSTMSSGRGGGRGSPASKVKFEKSKADLSIDLLMKDDFIDDGDDEVTGPLPNFFPSDVNKRELVMKNKVKSEEPDSKEQFSNQNFAKEMGFDVQKISQFIKKEKDDKVDKPLVLPPHLPKNELTELLTSNKPVMVLFQLPKSLTAPVSSDNHEKEPANVFTTSNEQKSNGGCSLSSLPEGKIGKLIIMKKSGHVRLKIGDLDFNLDGNTKLYSKHEVASIQTEGSTGDIAILGDLLQSFSFVPNVDSLLKK